MSKQKKQDSIRIHQVNTFQNIQEMMQFANAQSLNLKEKELIKAIGTSQGGQNGLQTKISQIKLQDNKNKQKKNVEAPKEILKNNIVIFVESFKSMILQKFQIVFKDEVYQISHNIQRKSLVSQESQIQNISQQQNKKNGIGNQFKKKEAKKQAQQKDQQQLELLQYQKNYEKEQIQKQIENETMIFNSQNQELQQQNIKLIEYKRIIEEKIQELNQQIKEESPDFNIKIKNENLQKKINIFISKIDKIQFNILQVDLNFDEYVKDLNNKLIYVQQLINMKNNENKLIQSQQTYDKSKKVISRRHNFEQYISQNGKQSPNQQFEEEIQSYKQEKQKLEQEYEDKLKFSQDQKRDFQSQQNQMKGLIKSFQQEILQNNIIEQNLQNKYNFLNISIQQLQELEKKQFNTEVQIRQSKEEFQKKILYHQNQITISENQLNEIREQMKQIANQQQKLPNIYNEISQTDYQMTINNLDPNSLNVNDLIEIYQNTSLPKDLKTHDEIINQEKQQIMILELNSITFFTATQKITSLYQTKWITQESLQSQDLLNSDLQVNIEQNQEDFFFITSDQINAFAEQLQIIDEAFYFKLPKRFRQVYPRLYILPSCFLEEFRQYYKQNKNLCINLIINYFEDFQAIQYQFQLIYSKIAFIIKEDSLYYVITVDLKNLLVIIYNSIPKPQQQYYEIQLCLNYLFSQLLKENIQFQLHVSPTFPIQNIQQNENLTGYYACIALQYFSKNQVNKNYLETYEIKAKIEKIKLKKIKSSKLLKREYLK